MEPQEQEIPLDNITGYHEETRALYAGGPSRPPFAFVALPAYDRNEMIRAIPLLLGLGSLALG